MDINLKWPAWAKNLVIILIGIGFLIVALPVLAPEKQKAKANFLIENNQFLVSESLNSLVITEENSLLPISNPSNPKLASFQKISVIVTAYSSSPWETDSNPHITAAGTWVRDGIVANNYLPLGTKIKIPELYGDKIFVVEDRMSWRKGNYHIDIWFPSYWEALNFGAKRTYIEILEG